MTIDARTPLVLEGRAVRLEPLTEAHVPALAAAGDDERIWRWTVYGQVRGEAAMRAWVRDRLAEQAAGTDLPFAVVHRATGQVIGATRYLDIQPAHDKLEIGGTWYALVHQRTAVNTECKYLLLRQAFEVWGCVRVQFKTDLRNQPSQRAIERLGAVREGVLRKHMRLPDGLYRDSVYYSVVDTEWPAVRARLQAFLAR